MNDMLSKTIDFQSAHGRLYDLNFSLPSVPEPTLLSSFKDKDHYKKIAQHYSGSLICWYDPSGSWTGDDFVVMWIDANGDPNLPLAQSFTNFLSILPYGTGIMYDVLYVINKHRNKPELHQYLNEDYGPAVWSQQLLSNKTQYANHEAFIDFISKNNIGVAKDPLSIIKAANQL